MLEAHCLFDRPSAAASRKEKKIIKDVGKIKRQKNVHQQGPKPNASICYLCDPSNFSSVPTFKRRHDEGGIGKKFETLISKRILNQDIKYIKKTYCSIIFTKSQHLQNHVVRRKAHHIQYTRTYYIDIIRENGNFLENLLMIFTTVSGIVPLHQNKWNNCLPQRKHHSIFHFFPHLLAFQFNGTVSEKDKGTTTEK